MTTTHPSEAQDARLIHRSARVHDAQYRAENALDAALSAAWDNGSHDIDGSDRERRYRSDVLAAVALLVQYALGVEDGAL